MHDDTHALTEVALALAMAFFAVLVLALVSMGVPAASETAADEVDAVALTASGGSTRPLTSEETLIVYFEGWFFDRDLDRLQASQLSFAGPVLLAVPNDLALADLLVARTRISSPNLSITLLDERWKAALEAKK